MAVVGAIVALAGPAGAAVTDNCNAPGGISMFPDVPGGQSNLSIACQVSTSTGATSSFYNTEDFANVVWHWGSGRVLTVNTTSASAAIVATAGHFSVADVGRGISGYQASKPLNATATPIKPRAFIKTVTDATHATMNLTASASVTGTKVNVEGSTSRQFADGHTTAGSTTLTSATANFAAGDVGRAITGQQVAHGTTIAARVSATQVTLSLAAVDTGTADVLSIGPSATQTTARFVFNGHTTSGSKTVTSATAKFAATDVNAAISGTGIPAGDTIAVVTNATTVTLATAATATSTVAQLTIGQPSATAPANGDVMLNLGAELDLKPQLVAGSDDCTANTPEGFGITGQWYNPGSYAAPTATFGKSNDVSIKYPTIGQFAAKTAVVTFAGYVEQVPAASVGETQTASHYDLIFPNLPTGISVCNPGGDGVTSNFEYLAATASQTALPTGVGTPNTASLRDIKNLTAASTPDSAYLHIRATNASTSDTFSFTGNCTLTWPDASDFSCGIG
jgi:hypothetical protein